jgi:hypothetical protein
MSPACARVLCPTFRMNGVVPRPTQIVFSRRRRWSTMRLQCPKGMRSSAGNLASTPEVPRICREPKGIDPAFRLSRLAPPHRPVL